MPTESTKSARTIGFFQKTICDMDRDGRVLIQPDPAVSFKEGEICRVVRAPHQCQELYYVEVVTIEGQMYFEKHLPAKKAA